MKTAFEYGLVFPHAQTLVQYALEFATIAHTGQARKYTNEPYINHPIEVAQIVYEVFPDINMICAALLHDVVEDCGIARSEIAFRFGWPIVDFVDDLTDVSIPEDGNRATRKALDRAHTAQAHKNAKTVKLADLISNSTTIVEHGGNFANIYMNEKRLLLDVLTEGHPLLWQKANDIVTNYFTLYPQE
jgi:(p)ppGpp synthase/HD superfamily hydrolase